MPGDYTRKTFDPRKHYAGVLMQQGRVQLDADWNEQQSIGRHRDETGARDVIGGCGAPIAGGGFGLNSIQNGRDLGISPGRIHVDGILCELETAPVPAALASDGSIQLECLNVDGYALEEGHWVQVFEHDASGAPPLRISAVNEETARVTLEGGAPILSSPAATLHLRRVPTFLTQPDFPNATIDGIVGSPPSNLQSPPQELEIPPGAYLAYLDVWRREISALDDPRIREVALGGPDTAARLKTIAQVRLLPVAIASPADLGCTTPFPEWDDLIAPASGHMKARTRPPSPNDNPCQLPPTAGYRRLENQLYRVEIHNGGDLSQATFKWSRDNGSVETKILETDRNLGQVTVSSTGKDAVLDFRPGQWVEVLDDESALKLTARPLVLLNEVEPHQNRITLDLSSAPETPGKLRRWDQTGLVNAEGVLSLATVGADGWIELEEGIQVQFGPGTYRSGDFWLIPARIITGEIEWPPFQTGHAHSIPQPHSGIDHHYCRLATISVEGDGTIHIHDCRCRFASLNQIQALSYISGDGQEAKPAPPFGPDNRVLLPQPLVVGIPNPECRERPSLVRFKITKGTGRIGPQGTIPAETQIDLPTNDQGMVECAWSLGADLSSSSPPDVRAANLPSQQVEATLLDENYQPIHLPIRFNANLSIAEQVAFEHDCPNFDKEDTVQAALTTSLKILAIAHHAGDGQMAPAGQTLPQRIEVRVYNKCGKLPDGLQVEFSSIEPGALLSPNNPLTAPQNPLSVAVSKNDPNVPDGVAGCFWLLDPDPLKASQQLTAKLVLPSASIKVQGPAELKFTGNHQVSESQEPGMTILKVATPNAPLQLGAILGIGELDPQKGISLIISCSHEVDPATVTDRGRVQGDQGFERGEPTCFVTVELPLPFPTPEQNNNEIEFWGNEVVGYRPVVLAADVSVKGHQILWRLSDPGFKGLINLLQIMTKNRQRFGDRILARLTLKGNFIWSAEEIGGRRLFLDGETFREMDFPLMKLPTGDAKRGGDFEIWFWLGLESRPVLVLFPGWNLVTYPYFIGNNTLRDIFANFAVNEMQFFKFNPVSQGFVNSTFDVLNNDWSPNLNWMPGEGAYVRNPTNSIIRIPLRANAGTQTSIPIRNGFDLVGCPRPVPATYQEIFGTAPVDGTRVFRLLRRHLDTPRIPDKTDPTFTVYEFDLGSWVPSEPELYVTEGAFVFHPGTAPPPLRFTVQPVSLTVISGAAATFRAEAVGGNQPLSFQWLRNGVILAGQTNPVLNLPPVSAADHGTSFAVRVTDATGASITSQPANLIVQSNPVGSGGTISFVNTTASRVLRLDGTRVGQEFVAQLLVGATSTALIPVGPPRPFRAGVASGLWQQETIALPNLPPGATISAQVRVWPAQFPSFEIASASGMPVGTSEVFSITTGGGTLPPGNLERMAGFRLSG